MSSSIESVFDGLFNKMWPTVEVSFDGVDADQIKSWHCPDCTELISLLDAVAGNVETYRIRGDSANGYEMYHKSCLDNRWGSAPEEPTVVKMTKQCPECGRKFDLSNEEDAAEWSYGHDCE